jgi:hypothetical protein
MHCPRGRGGDAFAAPYHGLGPTYPTNISDSLERVLAERVRLLGRILAKIEAQVGERSDLSERVAAGIWDEYLALRCELLPLLDYPFSQDRSWDRRRGSLEERLERLLSEARHEQVQRWRDQAQLWREHREWLRQYRDLAERLRLLGIKVDGDCTKQKR